MRDLLVRSHEVARPLAHGLFELEVAPDQRAQPPAYSQRDEAEPRGDAGRDEPPRLPERCLDDKREDRGLAPRTAAVSRARGELVAPRWQPGIARLAAL